MMDPQTIVVRALCLALEALPDHRVVLSAATWEPLREKYGGSGGLLLSEDPADKSVEVRLADHEDRAVLVDRVRANGGIIVEDGETVYGFEIEER